MKIRSKRIIALACVIALAFGLFSGLGLVIANAATVPTEVNTELKLVSDLEQDISTKTDIGQYLCVGNSATVAVPIDLTGKGDSTVQFRIYTKSTVTDQFKVTVANYDELYTAKRLTGSLSVSYNSSYGDSGQDGYPVMGYATRYPGYTLWNVALKGGKKYAFVIQNTNTSDVKEPQYGWGDVTIATAYIPSGHQGLTGEATLSEGTVINDFLTITEMEHTYVFKAQANMDSVLYFTFDGESAEKKGTGYVRLYNELGDLEASKDVPGSMASKKTEFSVAVDSDKAHTYYVKISGIYGATTMRISQSTGKLNIKKGNPTPEGVMVTIETENINVQKIEYINKEFDKTMLETDRAWQYDVTTLNGNDRTFMATEDGTYTIRVTTDTGRHYYGTVDIKGIDSNPPTIPNLKTYYVQAVTVRHADKDKDVDYMILDGFKVADGATVAEEGWHNFQIVDKAGNSAEASFCIDKTAPEINSDELKSKLPSGYYTFRVSDNISGIDSVTIDGIEQPENYVYGLNVTNNNHVIVVRDKAGNITQYNIKLDTSKSGNGGNNGIF